MRNGAAQGSDDALLLLPHRFQSVSGSVSLVHTSAASLRAASFLDGRTEFWTGSPIESSLEEAARRLREPALEPRRIIFHMSFCGSTLLAALLDASTHALVLKEPHLLVDAADWYARLTPADRFAPPRLATLERLTALVFALGSADRPLVVKPSNWINNLLPALALTSRLRPLFVTIEPRTFVRAVIRGGHARLVFTGRAVSHLATAFARPEYLLAAALGASGNPLGQTINLAALAHRLQVRLFERAIAAGDGKYADTIDFAEIESDPAGAVRRAANALGLTLRADSSSTAIGALRDRNAKAPGTNYSATDRDRHNEEIEHHHGHAIDEALAWINSLPAGALDPA